MSCKIANIHYAFKISKNMKMKVKNLDSDYTRGKEGGGDMRKVAYSTNLVCGYFPPYCGQLKNIFIS